MLGGLAPAQTPMITLQPLGTPPAKVNKAKPHDQFAGERAPVQQAYAPLGGTSGPAGEYQYLVEPPGPDMLFKLESESELQVRIEQEWRDAGHKDRLPFPDEPVLSADKLNAQYRAWPGYTCMVEPNFVCYKRLMFDQKNYERYGWDLGVIDPPVSTIAFFADLAFLPYHAFTDPFRTFECSAGYCLPGDPVPLLLYPPERSLTGAVAETGAILGVLAVFP